MSSYLYEAVEDPLVGRLREVRGYDAEDVQLFLSDLVNRLDELERDAAGAHERASRAEHQVQAMGNVESQLVEMVGRAQVAAQTVIAEAREAAARVLDERRVEGEILVAKAREGAVRMLDEARVEAETVVAKGREAASMVLDEARVEAEALKTISRLYAPVSPSPSPPPASPAPYATAPPPPAASVPPPFSAPHAPAASVSRPRQAPRVSGGGARPVAGDPMEAAPKRPNTDGRSGSPQQFSILNESEIDGPADSTSAFLGAANRADAAMAVPFQERLQQERGRLRGIIDGLDHDRIASGKSRSHRAPPGHSRQR